MHQTSLLTLDEAFRYLREGTLPDNFADRVQLVLEFDGCPNCDGVCCMHFVLRDWWSPDFDDCDGFCCPFCGEWERGKAAAAAICGFIAAHAHPRVGPEIAVNEDLVAIGLA